jgi:hypothetical protein
MVTFNNRQLYPREGALCIQKIGGWVGSTADMDSSKKIE